ncbi:gamma-glutamyltransferase [Cohnella lubricantis]|uniref:Glutathione hydrolase proenzyme n=1 Tax=Cohnella lubricantis TaxID=2163172 RepID=A0A841T672_9BACL|nr:gamma-glutamyltransferase [Cohnella lubricantis]MBB6676382.1 gamma-glutamyltransferase [Cohnella lubricantis]MBP2117611.1 gamma-glutamyltranspeptidase/glutathione hydrolase [Cohnella lubricantis]
MSGQSIHKPAIGAKTMVVSPHHLASAAGAKMLQRGGNAFDAAVAVSACLAVVYPHMTGLGGDAFWLTYCSGEGSVRAYNASGRSGRLATRDRFAAEAESEAAIPRRGVRSALTVPGMADGWDAILKQYGRLTLADVLEPAIGYALDGFPVSPDQHDNTASRMDVLRTEPSTAAIYLPGGSVPTVGSRFKQRQLGESLRLLAAKGRDAFYKGEIAKAITDDLAERGGLLTLNDFADHAGFWAEPIRGSYRGVDLYQVPPNSQGFTGIMALQALERFDLQAAGHGTFDYYHLMIEALKLSFLDRDRYLTDPAFSQVPLERLLSKEYAAELAGAIDPNRALDAGTLPVGSDTAYAAVVDEDGNAVSFIQSLYFEFGSAVTAGETGILLQNRGSFFSLDPKHVNRLEPNKRTFHTLMPAMACRDGRPYLLYGTQGGEGQPQTQTALLTRMVDFGMNPQQAVSEPRWVWGRTWGELTQELKVENRMLPETIERLARAGHAVRTVGGYDGIVGHAHAIRMEENGFRSGGTDPRCDGAAYGW